MAIAIYCKPVSHLLEQPNDNMWQTVFFFLKKKAFFNQTENLQVIC